MPDPGSFADTVKQQADIVRIVGDYVRLQKIENITFPEAVRSVAQKLGIQAPKQSFSPEEAREAHLRTVLVEMQERACAFFEDQLRRQEAAKGREYLAGRGLD